VEELFNATEVEEIEAYVKPVNAASLRLFRLAGFGEYGMDEVRNQPAIRFVLRRWGNQGDSDRE
jgi:RimJ/RimL family protein N-acetyltransferase